MKSPITLTDEQRAELRELCADPATTPADVLAWHRQHGIECTEDYARITLQGQRELAERRRRRREAHGHADLARQLADQQARAREIVGDRDPYPVDAYLLRYVRLRLEQRLRQPDCSTVELRHIAETVIALRDAEARHGASADTQAPRQIVIPPGTVELISAQVYGIRR